MSEPAMDVIGLGYKARSGKDTLAEYLVRNHGYRRIAFADPLKRAARELFGLTVEQVEGEAKEVVDPFWGVTPRNILQRMGTEAMRGAFGADFWVRVLLRQVHAVAATSMERTRWVITDVRFPNEAEAVKSMGGVVVRVDRPTAGVAGGGLQHASETAMQGWEGWDHVVRNDGTLWQLENSARDLATWAHLNAGHGLYVRALES